MIQEAVYSAVVMVPEILPLKILTKPKTLVSNKYSGSEYIAYFQSFTNTYADAQYLRELFMPVILRDDIRILSIATRPDCLGDDILRAS